MSELPLLERLREFLTSRRFMWILMIFLGVLVVIYFLFVTFLFDPFESDLGPVAEIVPRDADYFFRWENVAGRLGDFPVPRIWDEVESSRIYGLLSASGDLDRWGEELGIRPAVAELASITEQLPAGLDIKSDLLREVAVAGRGRPEMGFRFDGVIMLRVSLKVKAGVSLLGYDFVRDQLPESVAIVSVEGGRYRIPQFEAFGGQDAYLTRIRDVVLLASRPEWIDAAEDLQIKSGEGSLGRASIFYDNVSAHLAPGDQPVEVFLRWEQYRPAPTEWPGQDAAYPVRMLSRFVDPRLLRYLSGYWLPGSRFGGRIGGGVDLSAATDFQKRWYESKPLELRSVEEVASMVPATSFFLGGLSGDPARILVEFNGAMDLEARRFLDELVIKATEYQGLGHLLQEMGSILSPGLFLALRRNDFPPAANDPEHDDTPVPLFLLLGTLRDRTAEQDYNRLLNFFKDKADDLTRSASMAQSRIQEVKVAGGVTLTAFATPAIPGTGEILVKKISTTRKPLVLVTNSYNYASEFFQIAFADAGRGEKLSERPGFQRTLEQIHLSGGNVFIYFDPSEALDWLEKQADALARVDFQSGKSGFYAQRRPEIEARIRKSLQGNRTSPLRPEEERLLRDEVDKELLALTAEEERAQVPELREKSRRALLPLQWLDWVSLVFRVSRRSADLSVSGSLDLD